MQSELVTVEKCSENLKAVQKREVYRIDLSDKTEQTFNKNEKNFKRRVKKLKEVQSQGNDDDERNMMETRREYNGKS